MNISVCVGSSCHLRGSYNIIEQMKSSLARYGLTDKVNLGAAFCLGKCTEGVSIRFDDEDVYKRQAPLVLSTMWAQKSSPRSAGRQTVSTTDAP